MWPTEPCRKKPWVGLRVLPREMEEPIPVPEGDVHRSPSDRPGDFARAETGHLRFIGRARSKRLLKRHLAGWASPERAPDGGMPYQATHLNDPATVERTATSQEQINPPSAAASPLTGRASRGFNQVRRGTR